MSDLEHCKASSAAAVREAPKAESLDTKELLALPKQCSQRIDNSWGFNN
jgi:hypothetical protein